ncbi:SNARE-interacting protein KEULE-like isoform X4 [Durio zibethinus]|uniref:SNARE-interacting protein KEULE-like isoform X4 n=1 Tax=Durio zibethinus TaxID=66656 RepID=A0A6P5WUT7_DURZI|nr:SNARE-interacting protein KEULE-like isoform X4 [Durio zibethinus]
MSYSDSDSSSGAGDYKNFRQISRERLLYEMLRSAKMKDSKSTWKVLIMDKVTVKIMSYSCKMADITAEGVSLVEDIYRRRQPLPSMDAIYFIQPTKENVTMFLSDMSGRTPLYKKAFVYFSSPISRELVAHIKKDSTVLPRIGALSEMNLEYFAIDSQGFITDNGKALEDLFGDEENTHKGDVCLNVMATRIATVFASLREFPFVRYRAAKSLDPMTMTTFRDLIPTKLAAGIWNCLVKCKSIPNFPQKETCELLILDRSIDQIAGKINRLIRDQGLRELGQLEQDLVFGDAGMKDVIKFFTTNEEASRENKLRLLMILAAVYPEKFEGEKGLNLMKLAKLPPEDMNAVNNMRLLAPPSDTKKSSTGAFSLKFDMHKKKRAARKDRSGEQETWQLSRFYPIIEELVEKLSKGELSKDDYPCMNDPSPTFHSTSQAASIHEATVAHSMRSRRTPTWARPRGSDDGYSSDSVLRHASSDFKKMGKRIFVFIVGGGTRSELRVCHKLTGKLNREVVLGSTSLDDPPQFITKLKLLTAHEFSLDDLQI